MVADMPSSGLSHSNPGQGGLNTKVRSERRPCRRPVGEPAECRFRRAADPLGEMNVDCNSQN